MLTQVKCLQTNGYSFSVLAIGASCIGAIPVLRDEPDHPSCAVNISLSCDFTACQGSQTQCHKKYLAEKKVVLKQIARLRHKIKDIMKKQVVICIARIKGGGGGFSHTFNFGTLNLLIDVDSISVQLRIVPLNAAPTVCLKFVKAFKDSL